MIAAITGFLRALAAYWQFKAISHKDDLQDRLENQIEDLENEIEKHRNVGDVGSTDIADRLRVRLRRKKSRLKHLSNTDTED